MLRKTTLTTAVLLLVLFTGCESYKQSKENARKRWNATSAKINLSLAQQLYNSGKYRRAEEKIKKCIKSNPELNQAHLLYGKLLLAKNLPAKALSELKKADDPNNPVAENCYWTGVANEHLKNTDQARAGYEKALSIEPENEEYILAVVQSYVAQNKPEKAINLLRRKMEHRPGDISLKVTTADILSRLKRYDEAINLYKNAMLLAEQDRSIAESLAYCCLFSNKWDQAARIFSQLADDLKETEPEKNTETKSTSQIDKQKQLYLQMAALSYMKNGQYDRAVNCYNELSVNERDNARFWVKMGQAALGAGLNKSALKCGRKADSLRPGYPDAILLIGCAQYSRGLYSNAIKSFEKISSRKKYRAFTWMMRGRCYEQLGQIEKAENAYNRALEIDPKSRLGQYLAKGKNMKSGINPDQQLKK